MIPIGPSRAPRGMSRPVSSRSLSGILSRLVSSLGRVAYRMSPEACFEATSIHTVLNLTGQIVPFFTDTSTEKVFSQFKPGGWDLDIQRLGRLSRQYTVSVHSFGPNVWLHCRLSGHDLVHLSDVYLLSPLLESGHLQFFQPFQGTPWISAQKPCSQLSSVLSQGHLNQLLSRGSRLVQRIPGVVEHPACTT